MSCRFGKFDGTFSLFFIDYPATLKNLKNLIEFHVKFLLLFQFKPLFFFLPFNFIIKLVLIIV
jgi:hypothetical protein